VISDAVAKLRRDFELPVDPTRRGPVPLNRFFEAMSRPWVTHCTLPELDRASVADHLRSEGIEIELPGDPAEKFVGFLYLTASTAWAYVSADGNNLGRRRFTAAHELGHAVLHRDRMDRPYLIDSQVEEASESDDEMEREANRFAAELLMPVEVCAARAEELMAEHGCCPRGVLAYQLASELLVSREAMRYRLKSLGVGDE
jgi:hypothetical protein